ncbi:TPA: hypothetical protein UM684_003533 [Stenotrophomonas maltophilia]|nr:hypothetical protein [Stenotrophomonas maltophilia]MBH1396638.1 hypothetical protein [Stenotrophomonas maltophilia]MBH1469129.1 hypothetical protein [Stenotrophomonas maltophilia]MBH1474322.1 hypothetical protein [Stenotrophomonas maltophilia]HEL3825262.1 hypothetical protein [Stenotrophomonas maltophilia]
MAKDSKAIEFANVVVRFGEKVLLDHFDEIVMPSFLEGNERSYSDTRYFFQMADLVHYGEDEYGMPVLAIVGRFIKDGVLRRQQVYEQGELQQKPGKMKSSPSALFMLLLHNHRLIYVKETPDAPSMETFRTTLLAFLKRTHGKIRRDKFKEIDKAEPKLSGRRKKKDRFDEDYQTPTVQLIPLSSPDDIRSFVERYKILRQVKFTFAETNDENPLHDMFAQMRAAKEAVGADTSSLIHGAKDGLDKKQAITQISEATEQGLNEVQLRGIDAEGDSLSGNTEEFKLKKSIGNISTKPIDAGSTMLKVFNDLKDDGMITLGKIAPKTVKRIQEICREYFAE